MNPNNLLTIASLLSITLFILHLADDIVVGVEPGGTSNVIGVGGDFAKIPGAYFFIWTLLAMAVTGTFSVVLAAQGLWSLRSNRSSFADVKEIETRP